jgi:AmmeMemoRadiSam system protein B
MQESFYTGVTSPEKVEPIEKKVFGGIVSHHFYVEREISKLFSSWSKQNFETIVLLGPNHFSAGKADIIVSRQPYNTPWGFLFPEINTVDQILKSNLVKVEEDVFTREHSMSVLVGFIKQQFPKAKIVPIVTRRNVSKEKVVSLSKLLNEILSENSLVLASVDFSHHVSNALAQKQDLQTILFLEKFDADSIYQMSSTQIDSPASIYALLKYLELKDAKQMKYMNTNAALVSGNLRHTDVTSYIFASFLRN